MGLIRPREVLFYMQLLRLNNNRTHANYESTNNNTYENKTHWVDILENVKRVFGALMLNWKIAITWLRFWPLTFVLWGVS